MRKLLAMLIILVMVGGMGIQAVGAQQANSEIEVMNLTGEIVNRVHDLEKDRVISLNELKIEYNAGAIKAVGSINYNDVKSDLVLTGSLYPVQGGGHYSGNLVLGDIEANHTFNVLQFRIDNVVNLQNNDPAYNDKAMLSIVLEHKENGEWIRFQHALDQDIFKSFYKESTLQVHAQGMKEDDLVEKTISLLNIQNKASHGESIEKNVEVEVSGTADTDGHNSVDAPISTQSWNVIRVNFTELNRLFQDLKKPGTTSVRLANYNLPESLFKGSGWKQDVSLATSPRSNYYAASAEQIDYTITQITMFRHDSRFLGWSGNNISFEAVKDYQHGMILEYDHILKEIRVMYYGWGLQLKDMQIVQGALEDRNVYIAQTLSGHNLTRGGSGSLVRYLVGLIPYGDKVTDLWDALTHAKNDSLGQRYSFIGSTYEDQRRMHDNKVYRSVSGNLNQWEMRNEGSQTNFVGDIHSGDGYVSLRWSFTTTVSTNL